ncbi:MAG: hypothetical protein DSY89_10815 [Deltaproteobacteria bacterium]|nr:MAG: hypothetical protein DSY89_10815 [Deltaproteobacteria bacterium]
MMSVMVLAAIGMVCTACAPRQVRYLKNNIHTRRGHGVLKASYANWVGPGGGHRVIPVNTPIVVGRWKKGFAFVTQDSRQRVLFEYNRRNMPFSIREYLDLISSYQPVSLQGLSGIDLKGIRQGKALRGMSKAGVRIALGYPAVHQTPSLEADEWIYWKNRMRRMKVVFGVDETVVSVK